MMIGELVSWLCHLALRSLVICLFRSDDASTSLTDLGLEGILLSYRVIHILLFHCSLRLDRVSVGHESQ